jgi:hypothetical protein
VPCPNQLRGWQPNPAYGTSGLENGSGLAVLTTCCVRFNFFPQHLCTQGRVSGLPSPELCCQPANDVKSLPVSRVWTTNKVMTTIILACARFAGSTCNRHGKIPTFKRRKRCSMYCNPDHLASLYQSHSYIIKRWRALLVLACLTCCGVRKLPLRRTRGWPMERARSEERRAKSETPTMSILIVVGEM